MKLISDEVLVDTGITESVYPPVYPTIEEANGFWNPNFWTGEQPHALFKQMREQAPVMWTHMGKGDNSYWSLSRYNDIREVELKPEVFSSQRGSINMRVPGRETWNPEVLFRASYDSLINLDEPLHMDMRLQQKDYFIPQFIDTIRDRVSARIEELLDELEAKGPEVDFTEVFSTQLPLFTLCEMLGIDEEDRPRVIHWMHYLELSSQFLITPWKTFLQDPLFPFRFKKVIKEMFAYGERIMADRRANPRKDLLTAIAQVELNGQRLPQEFLDGSWLLIIFAGNDTTRNSLSGTLKLLTEFPDQKAMILDDPSMIRLMSQEALRLISPVKHMRRTALEDYELNGQRIAKDEKVVMWYGAGNRDPEVFPDPDRFDMTRDNVHKHIAFGEGVHKCFGSRVAQMQLRQAYTQIFDRFPNIEWTGEMKVSPNTLVHAISSLKVNLYGRGNERPTKVAVSQSAA